MARLGYLFPAFPVFHQTFVLWEVLGVQRNGLQPKIYSMWAPSQKQQPEGQQIMSQVKYLPSLRSGAVLRSNLRLFVSSPLKYLSLYREVVRAWRTGAQAPEREDVSPGTRATLYNRLRGWFNGHPLPYLAKSLALVPLGVYLAEEVQRDQVTHLHVHWATYSATVAYVAHLISGLKYSMSAHAYDIYMTQRMLPAKIAAAKFVVTCARTNQRFLARLVGPRLAEKVVVSYHGVDVSRFSPIPSERPARNTFTIGSCGQLERYKGMHLLVDACAMLRDEGVQVQCWIIGEGPEKPNLQRQIESRGLTDCVSLLGARPHAEIAERLRHSDAFALASELVGKSRRRDVIANVIVEAMAVGLPVVASHIPGAEELVEDTGTGYLVPPNDAAALGKALLRLAREPEERARLGSAARRRILAHFDSARNVAWLAGKLRQASGQTAPAAPMAPTLAVEEVA